MDPDPTLERLARLDRECDRFEAAFREGTSPRIEQYLDDVSPSERAETLETLLELEIELRSEAGATCRVDEFLERFPDDRAAVEAAFSGSGTNAGSSGSSDIGDTLSLAAPTSATSAAPARSDEPIPASIERFEIVEVIGEGAFGRVYRAFDPKLKREVALKSPTARTRLTQDACRRFVREGRAAAALRHPNICPVFELQEEGETPFIAMALIEGPTLAQQIAEKQYSSKEAAGLVGQLAEALAYAHEKGVVHRDLKPSNVMFDCEHDKPVIMDFGLAHCAEPDESQLTQSGMVIGTPTHMSPEQARGAVDEIDELSDVYSLGVIFYELLVGQLPFTGSVAEVLGKILHVAPEAPSAVRSDVDPQLEAICLKAMAKERAQRFASMAELAAALDAWQPGSDSAPLMHKPQSQASGGSHWLMAGGVVAVISTLAVLAAISGQFFAPNSQGASSTGSSAATPSADAAKTGSSQAPPAAANAEGEAEAVQVVAIDVEHFSNTAEGDISAGVIGRQSFTPHLGDRVQVRAKLSKPGYAYLIAFRPDGVAEICFPEDEDTPPPLTQTPQYPLKDRLESYGLQEGAGLWVFAVVASEEPLPPFREWLGTRQSAFPWTSNSDAAEGVAWWDDGLTRIDHLSPSGTAFKTRGKGEQLQGPAARLKRLTDSLRTAGAPSASAIGFCVAPPR